MYDQGVIDAFRSYAVSQYPKEAVGFIVSDEFAPGFKFLPMENIHAEPEAFFRVSEHDYLAHADRLVAVLHSHTNGNDYASVLDLQAQEAMGVPWGVSLCSDTVCQEPFWFGDQCPIPDLVGRIWRHNVTDCYNALRDYFRLGKDGCAAQGIINPYKPYTLPIEPREYEWWTKKNGSQNLYLEAMERNGFRKIGDGDVQAGDVCLLKIHSRFPNHAAVYLGNGLLYHHTMNDLSVRTSAENWMGLVHLWGRLESAVLDA